MSEENMDTNKTIEPHVHGKNAQMWLWVGVILFSIAIVVIWIFHTKTFIEGTAFNRDPNTNLLQQGKEDFASTVQLISESDNTGELLQEQDKRDQENAEKKEQQKDEVEQNKETQEKLKSSIFQIFKRDVEEQKETTSTEN